MLSRQAIVSSLCVMVLIAVSISGCGQPVDLPVPTPAPTATLVAGWKRLTNKGVSIAVPDTFVGGDLTASDQKMISDNLKQFGNDFERMAETIKQNPDLYLLYGMETEPTPSGIFTNLNVVQEKVMSAIDVAAYMQAVEKQLPQQFKIKSREETTLFGQAAGRVVLELTMANKDMTELIYLFKRGDYMYLVTYTTGSDEFEEKLPMFEQSIQTFTLNQ